MHRTAQLGENTLVVGVYLKSEIFKANNKKFEFVNPCPIEALDFGFSNKNEVEVYLYSENQSIFFYNAALNK